MIPVFAVGYQDDTGELVSYAKKLKSGWVLDGSAYYFVNPMLGLWLQANRFASSNSIADVYVTDVYGNSQYGTMSDNISITFIGPGAVFRQTFSDGNTFLEGATAGYIAHIGYDIRQSSLKSHWQILNYYILNNFLPCKSNILCYNCKDDKT